MGFGGEYDVVVEKGGDRSMWTGPQFGPVPIRIERRKCMLTKENLKREFKAIGINEGMVLVVHTSLRKIGYIKEGPKAVIECLIRDFRR